MNDQKTIEALEKIAKELERANVKTQLTPGEKSLMEISGSLKQITINLQEILKKLK